MQMCATDHDNDRSLEKTHGQEHLLEIHLEQLVFLYVITMSTTTFWVSTVYQATGRGTFIINECHFMHFSQ